MLSVLLSAAFAGNFVDLCHWDDGYATVTPVNFRAVSAHLAHGDSYPATYWPDADGDGYGDPDGLTDACPNAGFVDDDTDCDDLDAAINPGMPEIDNLIDEDCDVWVDEDFVMQGDVIVTEVVRQAWVGYTYAIANAQWFEVFNTSDRIVDLSRWYILRTNGVRSTTAFFVDPDAQLQLGPGDYAVFCKTDNFEGDTDAVYPLWCDYVWGDEAQPWNWQGLYQNNAFTLIRDADRLAFYVEGGATYGRLVDDIRWTWVDGGVANWPRDATRSMSLDPAAYDGVDNDLWSSWCSTEGLATTELWTWWDNGVRAEHGTPGTTNYDCP